MDNGGKPGKKIINLTNKQKDEEKKMKKLSLILVLCLGLFSIVTPGMAGSILVTEFPWGYDDSENMTAVFGAANYTVYNSYASATPGNIFNGANNFVMLEGGADSDINWYNYLTSNDSMILNWVDSGGRLLLMSAGWDNGNYAFGPGTLILDDSNYSSSGTLTTAGMNAFTFQPTPVNQNGNYLAHNYITGAGLTIFMTGDDTGVPIIAGTEYGAGYIMYAGLTDSYWHDAGLGLVNNVIAYTAGTVSPVPPPSSLLLTGSILAGLGLMGFRKKVY
jgi:hypothetical protein